MTTLSIESTLELIVGTLSSFLMLEGLFSFVQSQILSLRIVCRSLKIPTTCIDKINRVNKHFLWNASTNSNKRSRVNWKTVCLPKNSGGLGIRNLENISKHSLPFKTCLEPYQQQFFSLEPSL